MGPTNHRKLPTSCFDLDRVDDFVIRSGLECRHNWISGKRIYGEWQQFSLLEVQQRQQHTWLVSSEHLSSRLTSAGELDRLDAFLQSLFAEIEVHLVIRDPLQTAISAWSTLVRSGGYPLEELPPPDHPLLVDRCNHRTVVQRWQRVFPQLRVHIYEQDVVRLLRQAFALPEGLDSKLPTLARNPSLSHRAIVEIARLNQELPVYQGTCLNLSGSSALLRLWRRMLMPLASCPVPSNKTTSPPISLIPRRGFTARFSRSVLALFN